MKKGFRMLLAAALCAGLFCGGAMAVGGFVEPPVTVQLNGENLVFTDAKPQLTNERTFLPFYAVFNALGADVRWTEAEPDKVVAVRDGRTILLEGQLGSMKDPDLGIFPMTTSSHTLAGYGCVGAPVPPTAIEDVICVTKAYSSCVGEGPFTCEFFGEEAHALREAGGEYGAATGRPRRVGPFDVVASRYGIRCQGADEIALTKLDVLSDYEEIEICTHYTLDGMVIDEFPFTDVLDECKPVFEKVKGWNKDISKCRKKEELPKEALDYIRLLEKLCDCRIKYVSVGAEREAYIKMY